MKEFLPHARAYLSRRRNVKRGLISRSRILGALEEGGKSIGQIEAETDLPYATIFYHLKAMKLERIVTCPFLKKPYVWRLTGLGQQSLNS